MCTDIVQRYHAHWLVLEHTIPVYMSRPLPHIPPHTPYTSTHSPHTTVQPPHSIPSAPHNLIPSPSAQTLINTSTSKSDINPPQSQEHTAVSQHGYPYAVLMSDPLSLTSSITMPVFQDTGLLLISVMLFMQGRCGVVVEWYPRNPLMLKHTFCTSLHVNAVQLYNCNVL